MADTKPETTAVELTRAERRRIKELRTDFEIGAIDAEDLERWTDDVWVEARKRADTP